MAEQIPSASCRVIALVEWNTGGHHDTYLRIYSSVLLSQGHQLLVFCQNPGALRIALAEQHPSEMLSRLNAIGIHGPEWIRSRRRWPYGLAFKVYARDLHHKLRKAEKNIGGTFAEVYFACLYEHQVRMLHAVIREIRGRTWSGLYLHPHAFHAPDKPAPGVKKKWPISLLWSLAGLRGLLMLDEGIAHQVAKTIGRPVLIVPDIADATCGDSTLADDLRTMAAGRPIVGLLGHLVPSKGMDVLARCAMADITGDLVFAFAGEIHWEMFPPEDQALLHRLKQNHSHVWIHDGRIPCESTYNALFNCCDVVFAAYHNFPHSSNTLTKAAIFKKLVVVCDGHLMAMRARNYRLGKILPPERLEKDLPATLQDIASQIETWKESLNPDWSGYQRAHSQERLAQVLLEFFSGPAIG